MKPAATRLARPRALGKNVGQGLAQIDTKATGAPSQGTRPYRRGGRVHFADRLRVFVPGRTARLQLAAAIVAIALALSAQSFAAARESAATYVVKPGDTLGRIAAAIGVSVERLASLNGIANPDFILAGRSLELPPGATPPEAASAAGQAYVVQPGDSLWKIASRTGVSVQRLAELNGLTQLDRLAIGQRIRLPPGVAPPGPNGAEQRAASRPSPTASALARQVTDAIRRVGGDGPKVGVAAKNLATGEALAIQADQRFPSASVMKLPLLVELERQVASGRLAWTPTLRQQAAAMIVISDNAAANHVFDAVGAANVNATMARLGLANTTLINHFADVRNRGTPGQNETTPADMVRLLELLATDQLVSPQASQDMRSLLVRNADRSKLVRLLPADAVVAHKSGWFQGVANDAGIVAVPSTGARWVLAVFADDVPDAETGNQLVAAVSRTIYDTWRGI